MAIAQAMGFTDYQQFMLSISKNEDLATSADSLNHANLHQTKSVSTLTELANTPNSDASLQKTKTDDELDAEAFKFVVSKMLTFACFIFWTFCIVKTVELSPFLGLCMITSVFIFVVAGGKRVKQALINTSKAVAFVGIPVVLFIQAPILPASDTLKDAKKLAMEIHDRSLYHSMRLATEPPIPIRSYFDLESKKTGACRNSGISLLRFIQPMLRIGLNTVMWWMLIRRYLIKTYTLYQMIYLRSYRIVIGMMNKFKTDLS